MTDEPNKPYGGLPHLHLQHRALKMYKELIGKGDLENRAAQTEEMLVLI